MEAPSLRQITQQIKKIRIPNASARLMAQEAAPLKTRLIWPAMGYTLKI